ncbi:hypothetical protein ITJ43_14330 [Microbacterium sp. VKM Ac-2870]|uniref:hypothetical protein n=1 Tax=Microbacterium sp. VKM Ac-2870 TaxID=2783825 RepID=UPI00188CAC18|nr:hypothetical protein [Microbacterium sp. VKM Ac-2870]MBF4563308.1 hypothetical protein [Microbacterium sp. VKM Ac-2870]
MEAETLESRVLAELLALRKMSSGATVHAIAGARVICDLLGGGDPFVAYTRLCHEIFDSDLDLAVKAAAASLGLLAEGDTHLKRLDAFGADIGMDQRQVRRYSDRGVRVLARLISSNWPTETVPSLKVIAVHDQCGWELNLMTARLQAVQMRPVRITVLQGDLRDDTPLQWTVEDEEVWRFAYTAKPTSIPESTAETTIVIVWRGELWPKFTVNWTGAHNDVVSESLGNKLLLRLRTVAATTSCMS